MNFVDDKISKEDLDEYLRLIKITEQVFGIKLSVVGDEIWFLGVNIYIWGFSVGLVSAIPYFTK